MGVAPLFPAMMNEFEVSRATVALLSSGLMISILVMRIPSGVIASRIGLKRIFTLGSLLASSGGLSFLASQFWMLVASRILFGAGISLNQAAAMGLIMRWFPSRELPIINAMFNMAGPLGTTLALAITVPVAGVFGPRGALTLYGLGVFVLTVAWMFLGRESQDRVVSHGEHAPSFGELWWAARHKIAIMLALTAMGPMALWNACNNWLPTYYHEAFGWPLAYASSIASLINLAGIPAGLIGGILTSRLTHRGPIFMVPGLIAVFAGLGSFLIDNQTLVIASVLVLGLCLGVFWPALLTIPMEVPGITPRTVPMFFGGMYTIAQVGAVIAPVSVGFLTDLTGSYLPGLVLWSVASTSLFFGGLALSRELKRT